MSDSRELEKILALIGNIAVLWSDVELAWYLLFTGLMPGTPRPLIDAVFFMFDTSKRQRDLVLAVADAGFPPSSNGRKHIMRKRIGQLYARTNEISGDRNAAVHGELHASYERVNTTPPQYSIVEYRVSPGANPTKKNRLAGKKLESELRETLKKIDLLLADLKGLLDKMTPKQEVPPELIESLRRQGLQVPAWIVPRRPPPVDPSTT